MFNAFPILPVVTPINRLLFNGSSIASILRKVCRSRCGMLIRFSCQCGKKLKANANQAGRRGTCAACGLTIVIPRAPVSEGDRSPALELAGNGRWYYSHGQLIAGPVSLIDLQQMIERGTLSTSHLVLAPGAADWSEAGDSQALLFSSVPSESTAGHNAKTGQPPCGAPIFDSQHAVLAEAQVVPDASRCVQCGICSYNCPMAIDVRAYARRGKPIQDSRCLTCKECVNRCPRGVLQFERLSMLTMEG